MKYLFAGKACTHPCQYNSDGIHGDEEDSDKTAAGLYFCFTSADNFTRAGCGYHPKEDRQDCCLAKLEGYLFDGAAEGASMYDVHAKGEGAGLSGKGSKSKELDEQTSGNL